MSERTLKNIIESSGRFGLPTASPASVGLSCDRLAKMGGAMKAYVDDGRVPGVLTAIARHGKVVHAQAQGFADRESNTLLNIDSIFRIYSMTKPVTAVAMMLLCEEGKIHLDDPVANYLPEFSKMLVHVDGELVSAASPISIRHLLTHTSGLTYSMVPNVPAVSTLYEQAGVNEAHGRLGKRSLAEHVHALSEFPLIAHPGTAWYYSEGLSVAARVIEILSGQSYREFLCQRVFQPLLMVDTDYFVAPEKLGRLVTLYEQDTRPADGSHPGYHCTGKYGGDYGRPPVLEAGGAGLTSTAADYFRFCQMLMGGGELDGVRLLTPGSASMIMTNQLGPEFGQSPLASLAPKYQGVGFGLCGYVVTDTAADSVGHADVYGWSGWASTRFWIDPRNHFIGMMLAQMVPQPDIELDLAERMQQMTYDAIIS